MLCLCLQSSIIPVSRQLAAPFCSPTLHHHRNQRSVCTVALSHHPSAHYPDTEIHNKHTELLRRIKHRRHVGRKRSSHRPRRSADPDARAQKSKCVCVWVRWSHRHTHLDPGFCVAEPVLQVSGLAQIKGLNSVALSLFSFANLFFLKP